MATKTHGGKRPGAGRKPAPDKKIPWSGKFERSILAYLRSTDNATATIETAVKRSKGFRAFQRKES